MKVYHGQGCHVKLFIQYMVGVLFFLSIYGISPAGNILKAVFLEGITLWKGLDSV